MLFRSLVGKEGHTFLLTFPSGTVRATVVYVDKETGIAVLVPEEGEEFPKVSSYEYVSSDTLKRGQTVMGLTGGGAVLTGIVSLVDTSGISTSLDTKKLPLGAPIITTSGSIAGIVRSDGSLSSGSALAAALSRFSKQE